MQKTFRVKALNKYLFIAFVIIIGLVGYILMGCGSRRGNYRNSRSGVYAVYQATDTDTENFDSKMERKRSSLKELLFSKGFTKATVVREGTDRIRVEVPDVDDPSVILEIIGEPAEIAFVLDNTNETVLTGDDIVNASSYYSTNDGGYVVSLELTRAGQSKFYDATANNIGQTMSIIVTTGGQSTTISSPKINSAISGNAIITGNFTAESAETLVNQIMSSTFDVALKLVSAGTFNTNK